MLLRSCCVLLLTGALLPGPAALVAQEQPPMVERQPVRQRAPSYERLQVFTARRARLGVVVNPVAVKTDSIGALILSVTPNGPADKAGIRAGDIIMRLNGQSLVEGGIRAGPGQSAPNVALTLIAAGINAGDSVVVQYQRGKERRNTTLVAGDEPVWSLTLKTPDGETFGVGPPEDPGVSAEGVLPERRMREHDEPRRRVPGQFDRRTFMPRMFMLGSALADLELAPLNPELGRYFGAREGVLVINVPGDSHLGLRPGDVVFSVDGREVHSPGQLFRVLQSYEPGEDFKLDLMRMKKRETVTGSVGER